MLITVAGHSSAFARVQIFNSSGGQQLGVHKEAKLHAIGAVQALEFEDGGAGGSR